MGEPDTKEDVRKAIFCIGICMYSGVGHYFARIPLPVFFVTQKNGNGTQLEHLHEQAYAVIWNEWIRKERRITKDGGMICG